ncbi:MAG: hypothetical protein ACRDMA_11250 [Solirubrobacterales bacterium]
MASRAIGAQLETNSIDRQADFLAEFMRAANRTGLTAWDDPGGTDPFYLQGRAVEALREGHGFQVINELHRQGRMTIRTVLRLMSFGGLATVQRDTVVSVSRAMTSRGSAASGAARARFLRYRRCATHAPNLAAGGRDSVRRPLRGAHGDC